MKRYTTIEQITILLRCTNCVELLDIKEVITENQSMDQVAVTLYDALMTSFLHQNLISSK